SSRRSRRPRGFGRRSSRPRALPPLPRPRRWHRAGDLGSPSSRRGRALAPRARQRIRTIPEDPQREVARFASSFLLSLSDRPRASNVPQGRGRAPVRASFLTRLRRLLGASYRTETDALILQVFFRM